MVLLLTFTALTSLGFVAFALGYVFEYPELGVIGGILILGAGAAVMEGSLAIKTGEVHNTTDANETVISNVYQPVDLPARLSLGFLTMLLGTVLTLQSYNRFGEVG